MHDGEADIDIGLVRRLVAAQFPRLAGLPVRDYTRTSPGFAAPARRTVAEVLADIGA